MVKHRLTQMDDYVFGASTFVDPVDGRTYILANNWIRETDPTATTFVGARVVVANQTAVGVGMMENPSLHKRGEWYYWCVPSALTCPHPVPRSACRFAAAGVTGTVCPARCIFFLRKAPHRGEIAIM